MLHVKNILTGEITKVASLRVVSGQICAYYEFAEPSAKWLAKYPYFVRSEQTILDEQHAVECRVFTLADGYELTKVKSNRQKPAAQPAPAVADVPAEEPAAQEAEEIIEEPAIEQHAAHDVVTPQPAAPAAIVPEADALTSAFTALTPLFAGVQKNVTDAVMMTLKPIIDSLKKQAATQVQHIQITNSDGQTHQLDEVVCEDFEEILTYVSKGAPVYLYGAAGCGKSHTARKLDDSLGLPFY